MDKCVPNQNASSLKKRFNPPTTRWVFVVDVARGGEGGSQKNNAIVCSAYCCCIAGVYLEETDIYATQSNGLVALRCNSRKLVIL